MIARTASTPRWPCSLRISSWRIVHLAITLSTSALLLLAGLALRLLADSLKLFVGLLRDEHRTGAQIQCVADSQALAGLEAPLVTQNLAELRRVDQRAARKLPMGMPRTSRASLICSTMYLSWSMGSS